ncbi:MAG: hypothetical protein HY873_02445 [Chloroflexi bacterium]|nr:hypothetical protein [Chloroflexota bacterium]
MLEQEPTSVLNLAWRAREGTRSDRGVANATRRQYLDFFVDGTSLYDALGVSDWVSWLADWPNPLSIGELLPEGESVLDSEIEGVARRLLYVCPECGDLRCGAITAVIHQEGDRVVWKDFAELFWDPSDDMRPLFDAEKFNHVGPFYFGRKQYIDTLRNRPKHPAH